MAERVWVGHLFFGTGWLLYVGPLGATSAHAHHAHQVLVSPTSPTVLAGSDGVPAEGEAFVVPTDASHAILRAAPSALLLHLDPDSRDGRALRNHLGSSTNATSWARTGAVLLARPLAWPSDWASAEASVTSIVSTLSGGAPPPLAQHPAVKRALRHLPEALDRGELALERIAHVAGVSPSRLTHLFSQQVGIPMRPYLLWLRLQRAARAVGQGCDLTTAAHRAGFSDGAHLSRVCRRMFGIAPSEAIGVRWVTPPSAEG